MTAKQPNIYLDIDGVLLANEKHAASHVDTFLEYVTSNFPTFWLTTHCRGNAEYTVNHLAQVLDSPTLDLAKQIKATNWDELKTEGIDFTRPFLWFDDDLFPAERTVLEQHGVLENWIEVDLAKDPYQLLSFVRKFPVAKEGLSRV